MVISGKHNYRYRRLRLLGGLAHLTNDTASEVLLLLDEGHLGNLFSHCRRPVKEILMLIPLEVFALPRLQRD